MKQKNLVGVLLLLVLALGLAACTPETAEQVQEAVEEVAPTLEAAAEEIEEAVEEAVADDLPGDWSSLALYGAATLVLLPIAWHRRRRLRAGGRPLLLIGLSFGAVLTLWNHGVLVGEVVRVVLLFYLAPVWATGLAWLLLGERPGARRLVTILMGLGGAAVVLGFEGGFPLPRSEGGPESYLSLSRRRPRDQETRDIDARNQEQQRRGGL